MAFGTRLGTRFGTQVGTVWPGEGGVAPPSFSGVVDALIDAGVTVLGAYSTSHLLASAYEGGPLFTLRRAGGGTIDIPYGAATYRTDTAAMDAHNAGANGFVPTVYDQSGNGNDITQGTEATQPKIYDSVSGVNYQGTLPFAIFAGGSAQRWQRGDAMGVSGNANVTQAFFAKATGFAARRYMMHLGPAGANGFYAGAELTTGDPILGAPGVSRRGFTETTALTTASGLVYIDTDAALIVNSGTCRQDGVALVQSTIVDANPHKNITNSAFAIGADPAGGQPWDGSGCAWFVVPAALAGAALTALEDFFTTLRGLD